MITETYKVKSSEGLHARPVSLMTKVAAKYEAEIELIYNEEKANLKSIMSVLSLGVGHDESFTIKVSGENEAQIHQEI